MADAGRNGESREFGDEDERLYDEYVELAMGGSAPSPEEFLASRGSASADLKGALHEVFRRSPRGDATRALPWEQLGEYRLIERLGGGGMGVVFLAEERALGRRVALKVVRPELSGSAVAAERFRREARAVAQLRHPNIVTLFGAGEEHGARYLAMELVEGQSLAEMHASGALDRASIPQRVRWVLEIARALEYTHEHGVIHRDVKPSNIRITADGRAMLLDFGLARTSDSADATLTESFAGSPKYASPEQIAKSSAVDERTDVYSLGVTLYQLVTGRPPFDGDSVEQLFHGILTADAPPLRRLAQRAPRDLEIVTHKAMERDPAQRYASAGEFADDLEAVLELRPIRGRPPGGFERLRRTARRRPALAAAAATSALAALVVAGLWIARARSARAESRERARREVAAASERIDAYRESRTALDEVQRKLHGMREQQAAMHFSDAEYALLDEKEQELALLKRQWNETYYRVLDMLRAAEQIDPQVEGGDAVRAELHMERLREAIAERDTAAVDVYRELVRAHDHEGRFTREIDAAVRIGLATDPPGAEVFVFRYDELGKLTPGGEARFTPVPLAATGAEPEPGTWCLRLTADHGPARRGDLIVELGGLPIEDVVLVLRGDEPLRAGDRLVEFDGRPVDDVWLEEATLPMQTPVARDDGQGYGEHWVFEREGRRFELLSATAAELGLELCAPWEYAASGSRPPVACRAWRHGEYLDYALPPGAPTRVTACPLFTSESCSVGRTPLQDLELPGGSYLLVARLAGREELRVAVSDESNGGQYRFELLREGETPDGWARVPHAETADSGPVWIEEHETTCASYLEFLNDPRTLAELDSSRTPRLVPREGGASPRLHFKRGAGGRYELPGNWRADWPVIGISWNDASAYVAWRNARARAAGEAFEYSLPDRDLIVQAGAGPFRWFYSYGVRFRAKFSRCCFARPHAHPGPVMRFPIDESPFGVYDLTGGAFEWLQGWYDEPRAQRHVAGGAWGQASPEVLGLSGGIGAREDLCTGETGLRLVRRRSRGAAR